MLILHAGQIPADPAGSGTIGLLTSVALGDRHLKLPLTARSRDEADGRSGWFALFASIGTRRRALCPTSRWIACRAAPARPGSRRRPLLQRLSADFHAGRPTQPQVRGGGVFGALTWSTSGREARSFPGEMGTSRLRSAALPKRIHHSCYQKSGRTVRRLDLPGGDYACGQLVRQPDHRNLLVERSVAAPAVAFTPGPSLAPNLLRGNRR
jgi:hypothetical protein